MDAPIYIHRAFFDKSVVAGVKPSVRNRLYVIEGRDGSVGEEVAKTNIGRIKVYNLPDLDELLSDSSFFIVVSHLFNVGGGMDDSFIQYVDYSHPNGRWERAALGDFVYLDGMGVLDGDRIYYFDWSNRGFSFLANDLKPRISSFCPGPSVDWHPTSLVVAPPSTTTEKQKIYVYWSSGGP